MAVRLSKGIIFEVRDDDVLAGIPGESRSVKMTKALFIQMLKDGDGVEALLSPKTLKHLHSLGIVEQQNSPTAKTLPDVWNLWGSLARRYHDESRDANYIIDRNSVAQIAESMYAEKDPPESHTTYKEYPVVELPQPMRLDMCLGKALLNRRTTREFSPIPMKLEELSTLLYYSFGIVSVSESEFFGVTEHRTSPSAGARQECECYFVAHNVHGLTPQGIYHYSPTSHTLEAFPWKASQKELAAVTYGQEASYSGALTIFTTVAPYRLAWKYRHPRAYRLWLLNAGHYGQTFCLAATALGIGAFQTIAFRDSGVEQLLRLDPKKEFSAYLLSAGIRGG